MDSMFYLCPPKTAQFSSSPVLLSCKASIFENPISLRKPKLSVSVKSCNRSSFLGQGLILGGNEFGFRRIKKPFLQICPILAAVKRRKEMPFDSVIQRDKKLKLCLKIRKILMSQPDRAMPLREIGKYRKQLGLERGRRFIALLKKFPGVFEIEEEGAYLLRFKLTPEAESLYFEELKIRNGMEELLVVKIRKLLMMSLEKRILVEKIGHLRTDLGLPLEFRDTICHRYPQYFKVVPTERGPALELTHWDPELAVSAAEMAEEDNRIRELEEKNLIIDRPLKFNKVPLPKGLKLSKGEMRRISQFRDIPYISPYSDFSHLQSGSREKEKHACAVVHELLSLTMEKRTLVDHLTHFREEFRFSQQLRGMLIRHPDLFYVSLKGDRDSVFLREAYRGSQLVDKDRLLIIKEKMRALVSIPRFRRGLRKNDDGDSAGEEEREGEEGEEEWSDIDNQMGDEFDDDDKSDDEDYEDIWSDEDDTPPDFDDESDVRISSSKQVKKSDPMPEIAEDRALVFPDGRPREKW
ncbi:protein WHAT'S THIS FACTOR 1 homolog, chloroplastic [Silene latifolia]|uniref:protein WHAT'S THIS FACTOR 1 homolog, chloroplastic n=1 Tax=Silene latifolia TaxID=37657 RepID=UPI003D78117A